MSRLLSFIRVEGFSLKEVGVEIENTVVVLVLVTATLFVFAVVLVVFVERLEVNKVVEKE